jgi:hypothetical protein
MEIGALCLALCNLFWHILAPLDEAHDLISEFVVTLLGVCRIHCNMGEHVTKFIMLFKVHP